MSDLGVIDYMFNKNEDFVDPNMEFKTEMDMDLPLNYENTDFMSSEFFDSIFSLEKSNLEPPFESDLFDNLDPDIALQSDNSLPCDEIQCDNSTYSDSGLSSDQHDIDICDGQLEDGTNLNSLDSEIKIEPEEVKTTLPKQPIIILPNPNARKVIVTKSDGNNKCKINTIKPCPKQKQVLRVQTFNGNGRSVLLPFNIKDLKTIKIINANDLKAENIKIQAAVTSREQQKPKKEYIIPSPLSVTSDGDDTECFDIVEKGEDNQYPLLTLTAEEKRLLNKDGIQLPCRYPLTKHEERELKRIRRKIRNKISAQDSRKRKKEYVDGLEERVKQCSEENRSLMKRIKFLKSQNTKLSSQLGKLQALVFKSGSSRAHPATCLMIVMLSALLVSLPNLRNHGDSADSGSLQQYAARRALLYSQQATTEDALNMDEFLHFQSSNGGKDVAVAEMDVLALDEGIVSDDNNTGVVSDAESDVSVDVDIVRDSGRYAPPPDKQLPIMVMKKRSCQVDYGGTPNAKGYIEPDIDYDDDDFHPPPPPAKKQKVMVSATATANAHGFLVNSSTTEDK